MFESDRGKCTIEHVQNIQDLVEFCRRDDSFYWEDVFQDHHLLKYDNRMVPTLIHTLCADMPSSSKHPDTSRTLFDIFHFLHPLLLLSKATVPPRAKLEKGTRFPETKVTQEMIRQTNC